MTDGTQVTIEPQDDLGRVRVEVTLPDPVVSIARVEGVGNVPGAVGRLVAADVERALVAAGYAIA